MKADLFTFRLLEFYLSSWCIFFDCFYELCAFILEAFEETLHFKTICALNATNKVIFIEAVSKRFFTCNTVFETVINIDFTVVEAFFELLGVLPQGKSESCKHKKRNDKEFEHLIMNNNYKAVV